MRWLLVGVGAALLLAVIVGPRIAHGTAFNPLTVDECPAAAVFAPGATVFLFHGGNEEARRSIREGEVLAAFRSRMNGLQEAEGLVRVDATSSALCFRAVVLEGELRMHDVVQSGHAAFLVIPTDAPCLLESRH